MKLLLIGLFISSFASLAAAQGAAPNRRDRSYADDVAFLKKHTPVIVLGGQSGPSVAVAPAWQGRVMTSTADASGGAGYGWINDELISSGKTGPHINVFGGEDRFWLGPEGGQFAIFFKAGAKFTLDDWQTPAVIDTEAYDVTAQDKNSVTFRKQAQLENFSGATFDLRIDRTVRLLGMDEAAKALGVKPGDGVRFVAYESDNTITNTGKDAWKKDAGLLSIWILGMFKPSDKTTVVVPYVDGPTDKLGRVVNDEYFGKVPAERLKADKGVLFFSGDGKMRTKIGVGPKRAKSTLGSFDAAGKVLTIVQYTLPAGATDYVNSMWELQKEPFGGDVVNSYNDGPPKPGAKPLGPFYELETSSPAAMLAPGASQKHTHRTFHFEGSEAELDALAEKLLGVSTAEISNALK